MLDSKFKFSYKLFFLLSTFVLSFCSSPVETESSNYMEDNILKQFESISPSELSQEEIDGIIFMREEEKLARDFYIVMFEKWGQKIFDNISNSEQKHMDAVKILIERYELDDPIVDDVAGEFRNADLQNLYNSLFDVGSTSLLDALKAGAIIEETDIVDLQENLISVDNEDITLIYNNLINGSKNHLRAFVRNIEAQGVAYTPSILSEEEYKEILSSVNEKGNKGKRWGNR